MMDSRWEIWICDSLGNRLEIMRDSVAWEVIKSANEDGSWQLVRRPKSTDRYLYVQDAMVEFWRAPTGGILRWVDVGFIRKISYEDDRNGREVVKIAGSTGNDLLNSRIVAYNAGTAPSSMTAPADDMMKEIVRDNMGADASASRDLTSLGFTVAPNVSRAPSITKKFAWRVVSKILREIANTSRENGTNLYFDIVPKEISGSKLSFEFRTYTGQRGMNRTASTLKPAYFGKEWGNIQNVKYSRDFLSEINAVWAGGQGDESNREIIVLEDAARLKASPWARREEFADARNESTSVGVQSKGEAMLERNRPRVVFSGDLIDTDRVKFGRDWDFGDLVSCSNRKIGFDAEVSMVRYRVDETGEMISAKAEVSV